MVVLEEDRVVVAVVADLAADVSLGCRQDNFEKNFHWRFFFVV